MTTTYDGMPVALRRINADVAARGGAVVGSARRWALTHPDPRLPAVTIVFAADGDVAVQVTAAELILLDASVVATPDPGHGRTGLEYTLDAILSGGYLQFVATTPDGQPAAHGWQLHRADGIVGNTGYDLPMPADAIDRARRTWRYHWTQYPAWPSSAA